MNQPIDLDLIKGELSRRSFKEFVKLFWPVVEPASPFMDGFHIDAIADHLTALTNRQIRNLLINIPPKHAKSTLCCVFFPAWTWLHNAAEQFLYSSYSLALSERDSVRCRRLIGTELYQKLYSGIYKITLDQNTKRRFANNKGGERLCTSTFGTSTGEGGSVICVDDPHSVNETESDLRRQSVTRWFAEVFFNRIHNPATGCRLVIGQRIAADDLSGFILENYGTANWCHLNLPYEYRAGVANLIGWTDPRTIEGQPLWPERFPESEIAQLKKKPRAFAAQYNQNPLDVENAVFKPDNFRYYDLLPEKYVCRDKTILKRDCFTLITADLALSTAKNADYTAICVASVAKTGEVILLDMVRERMPGTQIVPRLVQLNTEYQPAYILIEDILFQKVIVDQARAEGLPVRGVKPVGDKEARSYPLQTRFSNGQVWFPKDRTWVQALEKELIEFPQGSHDDMVDALSYLAAEAGKRTRTSRVVDEQQQPGNRITTATWADVYQQGLRQGIL